MKICKGKTGPHQYQEGLRRCPECTKNTRNEGRRQKRLVKDRWKESGCPDTELKSCSKGHQYPTHERECPQCRAITNNKRYAKKHPKPDAPDGFRWCKKRLHLYSKDIKECPDCRVEYRATQTAEIQRVRENWIQEGKPLRNLKECSNGHSYPSEQGYCIECDHARQAKYRKTPKAKEKVRARSQTPEYKAKKRAQNQRPETKASQKRYAKSPRGMEVARINARKWGNTPKGKAYKKAQNQSEKVKAIKKEYASRPEVKEARKIYAQTPERKAKQKAYQQSPRGRAVAKVVNGKRTARSSQGDLTTEQWEARVIEFDNTCAYCLVQLLTKVDGVPPEHPNYQHIDHIMSLLDEDGEFYGENTLANVVPACRVCNESKGAKDVWQWMELKNITPSPKLLAILNNLFPSRI